MIDGIDISHHNGAVNWAQVRGAGIQFAFAKATEGVGFVNSRFGINWPAMRDAGLVRGAYHYFRVFQDADAQAENFLRQVQFQQGDLPPVVDVEGAGNRGATNEQWINGVRRWLDHVRTATNRRPIIYTRANYWNAHLNEAFGEYPLWVAHYGATNPTIPRGWATWTFWQNSQSGAVGGVNTPVDTNRFNGDSGQLAAFAAQ